MTRLEKGLIAGVVAVAALSASTLGIVSTRDVTPEVTVEAVAPPAVLHNQTWVCRGPVDIDLVSVTIDDGSKKDAISLRAGCTGRIGRIEGTVVNGADCLKVQNASLTSPVHDLTIEGGFCNAYAHPFGVHQDGAQIMGGKNILVQNVSIWVRGALGAFAVSRAGGLIANPDSNPTNVICDGCKLGPQKGLRIGASVSSGARNTVTCGISVTTAAIDPVKENVTVVGNNDPRCQG